MLARNTPRTALRLFANLWQAFLGALYPERCAGCRAFLGDLATNWCALCRESLLFLDSTACQICGVPSMGFQGSSSQNGPPIRATCARCTADPPAFKMARAGGEYGGAMERALIRLKYGGDLTVAKSLAEFLAPDNQPDLRLHGVDVVVPIPLHPKRLKERGYDQATVLAQQVARLWKRPMVLTALKRDKATRSQVGLTVDARQQNVREAFAVSKRGGGKIAGKRVLVVDDVMTTGATGAEAAKELKKAGAKSVCLLTAARATKWS